MTQWINQHPLLFLLLLVIYMALSGVHIIAAVEYGKKHGRPHFEGLTLALFMMVGWWLFSIGMLFRGYGDFYDKQWGDEKKKAAR